MAHWWAGEWLHNACCLVPNAQHGDKIRNGPRGHSGYLTPAFSGVPDSSERGTKSEAAHGWAEGLHNPCRLGGTQLFRAGRKFWSGPLVGLLAT